MASMLRSQLCFLHCSNWLYVMKDLSPRSKLSTQGDKVVKKKLFTRTHELHVQDEITIGSTHTWQS